MTDKPLSEPWVKLPPVPRDQVHKGCLTCTDGSPELAPMNLLIAVGFGYAAVTCDGREVYNEMDVERHNEQRGRKRRRKEWEVREAEDRAAADPDHDWRIHLEGPLRGRVYQRQGEQRWVLVESSKGFA